MKRALIGSHQDAIKVLLLQVETGASCGLIIGCLTLEAGKMESVFLILRFFVLLCFVSALETIVQLAIDS